MPSDVFLRALFEIFSLCSGCFCRSIRRGTAQSSSFWLTPTPGFANAGRVQKGRFIFMNQFPSIVFLLVATHRCLTLFQIDCLQTCVRKSPSWTQTRAHLFALCSNTFVSSISSTIWHLHASWRETIFCPLVRCGSYKLWKKKTTLISLSSMKAVKWL